MAEITVNSLVALRNAVNSMNNGDTIYVSNPTNNDAMGETNNDPIAISTTKRFNIIGVPQSNPYLTIGWGSGAQGGPLFTDIGDGSTFENISLRIQINNATVPQAGYCLGLFVGGSGSAKGRMLNNITFRNCRITTYKMAANWSDYNVNIPNYFGGFVGAITGGVFDNCIVANTGVTSSSGVHSGTAVHNFLGGLAGLMDNCTVTNCLVELTSGEISAVDASSGGQDVGKNMNVINGAIGAIAGKLQNNTRVQRCVVKSSVLASRNMAGGGICGIAEDSLILECENSGNMGAPFRTNLNQPPEVIFFSQDIGGIAGQSIRSTIRDCVANMQYIGAKITFSTAHNPTNTLGCWRVGGICAKASDSRIIGCRCSADLVGVYTGGIAYSADGSGAAVRTLGRAESNSLSVSNNIFSGNIDGDTKTAGIVAVANPSGTAQMDINNNKVGTSNYIYNNLIQGSLAPDYSQLGAGGIAFELSPADSARIYLLRNTVAVNVLSSYYRTDLVGIVGRIFAKLSGTGSVVKNHNYAAQSVAIYGKDISQTVYSGENLSDDADLVEDDEQHGSNCLTQCPDGLPSESPWYTCPYGCEE